MSFYDLVRQAIDDTFGPSLWNFRPELVLCATIVVLLLARMMGRGKSSPFVIAMVGTLVAIALAAP